MRGNVLLAVLTLMVAMILLAPAILAMGDHRGSRKKSAAATAGPGGVAYSRRTVLGDPLRWRRLPSLTRRDHSSPRARRTST